MAPGPPQNLVVDLELEPTKVDLSLYFSFRLAELVGINGTYVDDLVHTIDNEFRKKCAKTHQAFEKIGDNRPPFTFSGFNVSVTDNESLSIDQNLYRKQLEYFYNSSTFSEFRSMRMKLAWLANTRPDLQFAISQLAQVTQARFDTNAMGYVKNLNSTVRYGHDNAVSIRFPRPECSSIRLVGFSDAAYAKNHDLTSKLGRIMLIMDDSNIAIQISFKSYKSRRVTRY